MALAKYFSKDVLAIMQLIKKGSASELEKVLNKHTVEICFDHQAIVSDGEFALDLSIKLLCRLYPKIKFTDLTNNCSIRKGDLIKQALNINSNLEITEEDSTICIIIGSTMKDTSVPAFYVGSNNGNALLSTKSPVISGNSCFPFASGMAACLGAANIFRYVFKDFLNDIQLDEEICLSIINNELIEKGSIDKKLNLGEFLIVGLGAIGNGALWALSKLQNIQGKVRLIDDQKIDLSNLQRYICTHEYDENKYKVEFAKEILNKTKFIVIPHQGQWADFVNKNKGLKNEIVLTAVDSAKDRISVQSSLPKYIINAYTDSGILGISRHFDFSTKSCLCCVYMPSVDKKSKSSVIAENLGIPHKEKLVSNLLYLNSRINLDFLSHIAKANAISLDELKRYEGIRMMEFYSNFVCGGIIIKLRQQEGLTTQSIEAPLAFQSAMAGILLITELFIFRSSPQHINSKVMTQYYPLAPILDKINPYHHNFEKDKSNRCLCQDKLFQNTYKDKWQANQNIS